MLDSRRIEGILFDLDGTLLALRGGREGGAVARWLAPLAPLLPDRDPVGAARRLFVVTEAPTMLLLALLDRSGLMGALRPLADRARRAKGIGTLGDLEPIEGVPALLGTLHGRYPLGVLTNRARREAHGFLEQNRLAGCFDVVVTRQDLWRFKPHPAPLRHAARALDLAPERLLMVGDMPVDMEAAHRAGAQALGVLTGFATAAELHAAGADLVVESAIALPTLLDGAANASNSPPDPL